MSRLYSAIATDTGWRITDHETPEIFHVSAREVSQNDIEHAFDGLDSGPDDLCVVHLSVCRDFGLLEFLNGLIADRFELPSRFIATEMRNGPQKLFGNEGEASDTGNQVLHSGALFRGHFLISRTEWLRLKAQYAGRRAERESGIAA